MIDVYILDKNLTVVGLIDSYKSLIWAKRYSELGDCELYLDASSEFVSMLQMGYYLMRTDDDMLCQIRKIEIETSALNGNYIIVSGVDTKAFLDQRIVWTLSNNTGRIETFIRDLITAACITPTDNTRKLTLQNGSPLLSLGTAAGFTEQSTEQVTYKNLGEKIRDYCNTYKWGYRFVQSGAGLKFELYKGNDLSNKVIFSEAFENLSSTKYADDKTLMGNVGLVGGTGEGSERILTVCGAESGLNRYEIFVDAKDLANVISYKELTETYPTVTVTGTSCKLAQLDLQIVNAQHLAWLQTNYPGGSVVTVAGVQYYRLTNVKIATAAEADPQDNTSCTLEDLIYNSYLLMRGAENLADYGEVKIFEGSVIPDVTFVYKVDYNLGDVVSVENEFGISADARIVEVVEVLDDTGYRVEPKFEYVEES